MFPSLSTEFSSSASTLILSTLQKWFNSETPISRGEIKVSNDQLGPELFWIDAMTMQYPFQSIFSVGLSNHHLQFGGRPSEFNRVELMMHLPIIWPAQGARLQLAEYRWPEEWLRQLVVSICDGSVLLSGSHVIVSNDEPLVPLGSGTEQNCFLLMADFYECFPIQVSAGEQIHFYHVIPLYKEERDYEKANGMKALLEAMAGQGLDSLVVRPERDRFVN